MDEAGDYSENKACGERNDDMAANMTMLMQQQMMMFTRLLSTMEENRLTSERLMMETINRRSEIDNEERRTESFHIMPDLSKNIENFDGEYEKNCGGAKLWLERLQNTSALHKWPESFIIETAKAHLVGAARKWYDTNASELKNWRNFQEKFKKTFCVEDSLTSKWSRMEKRHQKNGESISAYFHDKYFLCKTLNLTFEETKEQILIGLRNKIIVQGIMAKDHTDSDSLLHDIINFERINDKVSNKNYFKSNDEKKTDVKERTCYKCGEKGHIKTNCKSQDKLCFVCKDKTHIAKNCPKKPIETVKSEKVLKVNFVEGKENENYVEKKQESVEKFLRPVKINGVELTGMIDNGSSMCIIRENIVRKAKWPVQLKDVELYGYGCGAIPVKCIGVLEAQIKVDSVYVNDVEVCVVPDNVQTVDVIIGRTFTENQKIAYYRVDDELNFLWRDEFPFKDTEIENPHVKQNLCANENTIVKAGSVNFIECKFGDNNVLVPVANDQKLDLVVRRNEKIGTITDSIVQREELTTKREVVAEDINVDKDTPPKIVDELIKLCNDYRQCFAFSISELGCTDVIKMDIRDNNVPVISKPYRASMKERETISEIVEEWKRHGIVSETTSTYASPVLLVQKKTGEPRLVVNYKKLNRQTEKVPYPIPTIEEQFENLSQCKIFTTLDLAHGYLQIPLTEEAKAKTAFITPDETGQFERMIFGLTNAPYEFCRLMNTVLGPLRNKVCMCYIDDLLIGARDWTEMMSKLKLVFDAFSVAKLTLKLKKCLFGLKKVEYLGYQLSDKGISPGTAKVEAVKLFPKPKNVHEVRRFLGMTAYFRRFIPNYAVRAKPLSDLTRKTVEFEWTDVQENAFIDLINMLSAEPVLNLYNPKAEVTELHCDASSYGLAGILMQGEEEKNLHPVYYVSKKTTEVEARYHSSKLELMAVVWSIQRLHNFLIGLKFTVYTDCQAIVFLNSMKTENAQITRWFNLLQEYDVEIKHREGKKMSHVDAMSRAPVEEAKDTIEQIHEKLDVLQTMNDEDYIMMIQKSDKDLCAIMQILKKEEEERTNEEKHRVNGYELDNGRLFRKIMEDGAEKYRYVIPRTVRKSIVVKCHDLMGHYSVDRTVSKIKEKYWFPRMKRYVRRHISACPECLMTKVPGGKRPGELHPPEPPRQPFQRVHIDHVGPFIKSKNGNSYVLVLIDALTKFERLYAVGNTRSTDNLKQFQDFVNNYGIPKQLVTDRGTCFTSEEWEEFCDSLGIKQTKISTRWPQANGQVERVMRTLIPTIMTSMENDEEWDEKITEVERNLNSAVNKTTNKTPFESLYGYLPEFGSGRMRDLVERDDPEWQPPTRLQDEIRERIKEQQQKYKDRYDSKRYKGLKYEVGDIVMMRAATTSTGESTKLQPKYKGPYAVIEVLPGDTYRISTIEGADGRRYTTTANVSQLKLYRNADETESESENESEESDEQMNDQRIEIAKERPKRLAYKPKYLKDYELK